MLIKLVEILKIWKFYQGLYIYQELISFQKQSGFLSTNPYLKKVDGWDVKSNNDKSYYLTKDFKFKNFIESQNFINKVG